MPASTDENEDANVAMIGADGMPDNTVTVNASYDGAAASLAESYEIEISRPLDAREDSPAAGKVMAGDI